MKKILFAIIILVLLGLGSYFKFTCDEYNQKYMACRKSMDLMSRVIEKSPKSVWSFGLYQKGNKNIFVSYEFLGEGQWRATEYLINHDAYEERGQKVFTPKYNEFMYYIYNGKHFEYIAGSKYYGNKDLISSGSASRP